jgi:4-amino-4-deoxy-L-arabinose transferase-like glycosyltransferase
MGTATHDISTAARDGALPGEARGLGERAGRAAAGWRAWHLVAIVGLWAAIFAASVARPPLLDDADATHAQAAQAMLRSGDWVTLHVDGVRYLEKPPLPYWIAAVSLKLLGNTALAIHLPLALTVLGLALLGYGWGRRAFGERAGLYAAVFLLTSAGVFLFTRVFLPDALLSLLLAFALVAMLRVLEAGARSAKRWAYGLWLTLALAVLTKGLVALVFFIGTAVVFLAWSGQGRRWREVFPFGAVVLAIAVAAPWHILAGMRNTGGAGGHGFFWFYFVNEHVLRFLGRRVPRDYNKLPAALYWSLHLVWLFPWSLFAPAALLQGWRMRNARLARADMGADGELVSRVQLTRRARVRSARSFGEQTTQVLVAFSALVLVFFSLSTNQEYYTFPVYLPLLMLLAAALAGLGDGPADSTIGSALGFSFVALTLLGLVIAAALGYGLWSARGLPFVPDIGALLAHRGVGDYTLSMSHFFDLTGRSFAALRLPAALALGAFAIGPGVAWWLFTRRRLQAALMMVAATSAVFLVAAHIALVRFAPMLSSENFAETVQRLEVSGAAGLGDEVLIYGDQAFGSSIPFYLQRQVMLVDGRSTSMLFGSTFADAPKIFLTPQELVAQWGVGPRKLLFVPLEQRDAVDRLLGARQIVLQETSGKALVTDRALGQVR